MDFFFVIGILVGIVLAVAITMFIMISVIKKTNDWGDYDALEQSMVNFEMLESDNHVKRAQAENGE